MLSSTDFVWASGTYLLIVGIQPRAFLMRSDVDGHLQTQAYLSSTLELKFDNSEH